MENQNIFNFQVAEHKVFKFNLINLWTITNFQISFDWRLLYIFHI